MHIFRHPAQKLLDIRQYDCVVFIQSDEKSDYALCAPDLISASLTQQRRLNLKKHRPTDRPMTTPLFLLRCIQLGISLSELDMLTIGIVNDMFSERERDEYEWVELATDSDMAAF